MSEFYYDLEKALKSPAEVRELHIGNKGLSCLPPAIGRFKNLEQLRVSNNQLTEIDPTVLAGLPKLFAIDLSYNRLKDLPKGLDRLPALRQLRLRGNPLR